VYTAHLMPGITRLFSRRSFTRGLLASGAGVLTAMGTACNVKPPLAAGKQKLNIWTDATFAPASDDYQTEQIKAWAKENNVEVEVTRDTGANVQQKLQAAIESKQLPDISQVDSGRFTLFYPTGIFADVSDLYKEFAQQWKGFYKVAEQVVTADGKQWALPYSIDSALILYWRDVLEAGGVTSAPKTWDEFYDVAKRLQRPPDLYGVGFQFNKAGTDAEGTFTLMLYSFGGSIQKADSRTPNIKSPETLFTLNYIKKTWDMGVYPPGVTGWDNASNNTALQDKKVIFIHNPASPLVWFRNNKPQELPKIGVTGTPGGPRGQFNSAYLRDGFALFKQTPEPRQKLARSLMKHLYSTEVYRQWMTLAFPAPAVAGMEDLEIWKNPQRAGFLEAAKTGVLDGYPGRPNPALAELGTYTPMLTMILRVIVDKWTPEQAIDEMDKLAQDIYKKHYR
jgi:multiple sugar transport system substrate-binding protein